MKLKAPIDNRVVLPPTMLLFGIATVLVSCSHRKKATEIQEEAMQDVWEAAVALMPGGHGSSVRSVDSLLEITRNSA